MSSPKFTAAILRRAVAGIGVASLAIIGLSTPASAGIDGVSTPTFDTYSGWDGVSYVQPWGHPNTATYGQTITIPAGKTALNNFTFYMAANTGTGTITYRGELYGWNGIMATTKVWQSRKKTIAVTQGDPTVLPARLRVRNGPVTAGAQYVLFLTVSKDYEITDPNVLTQWAANYSDVLPGGDIVYMNDGGDESQWTTQPWSQITGYDFAFKATLT